MLNRDGSTTPSQKSKDFNFQICSQSQSRFVKVAMKGFVLTFIFRDKENTVKCIAVFYVFQFFNFSHKIEKASFSWGWRQKRIFNWWLRVVRSRNSRCWSRGNFLLTCQCKIQTWFLSWCYIFAHQTCSIKTKIKFGFWIRHLLKTNHELKVKHVAQPVDYGLAVKHYRKTSDMKITGQWMQSAVSRASFNLGFMHQFGLGVTQDMPSAKRFYERCWRKNV
jgi:hypothetical protein